MKLLFFEQENVYICLMKVLLVIPPFYQPNALYPSISQLAGFLKAEGYAVDLEDLSLNVLLRIFSKEGLEKIFNSAGENKTIGEDPYIQRIMGLKERYINIIDSLISFLQGHNPSLAYRIVHTPFIPSSPYFDELPDETEQFGELGILDRAKYIASIVIDELTRFIQKTISPHFGLSRYAEQISLSPPTFDKLYSTIQSSSDLISQWIFEETIIMIDKHSPDVIGYSVPFPGNVLGMFLSAKKVKEIYPEIKIIVGGGFPNTELRKIKDPRVFQFIDYLCLDDGEMPLLNILRNLENKNNPEQYVRTFFLTEKNKVAYVDNAITKIVPFNQLPPPYIGSLNINRYFSLTETLNPMHRLWSNGFWNKIALAHGCYWHKCTFCDTTLDYIKRYQPADAIRVVDWMEELIQQTGHTGFHFVDEAAPPSLLKEVALEILRRNLHVTWWGNIRFEKAFTQDLALLLAESGCIAVTGGLEVATSRLLKLINKGITVEQVAQVCNHFQQAGIMVHAYLMYGFPTQTEEELIESLEYVRQLFKLGLIQSAFWHRFALTVHSPIAKKPHEFQIKISSSTNNSFATNDLLYEDSNQIFYDKYSFGLKKALYNYMHGVGLDWDVRKWFDFKVPKPRIPGNHLLQSITNSSQHSIIQKNKRSVWLNPSPILKPLSNGKIKIIVHFIQGEAHWIVPKDIAFWLKEMLELSKIESYNLPTFTEWAQKFPKGEEKFQLFTHQKIWNELRTIGLLWI